MISLKDFILQTVREWVGTTAYEKIDPTRFSEYANQRSGRFLVELSHHMDAVLTANDLVHPVIKQFVLTELAKALQEGTK